MSIIVSNLSPLTTEETLYEFFNFCGKVWELKIVPEETESIAYVTFESLNSANVSLILTKSQIDGKIIEITLNPDQSRFQQLLTTNIVNETDGPQEVPVEKDKNQAVHVIASLMAKGHQLGDKALEKAKLFDEEYGITSMIQSGIQTTIQGFGSIDQKIGLTEKINVPNIKNKLSAAAQATDSFFSSVFNYASEKVGELKAGAANFNQKASDFTSKVMEEKENLYPRKQSNTNPE